MAVALVTGGAIRVGKAIAIELAKQGFDIALHFNGSEPEANQTAEEIKRLGQKVVLIQADLKNLESPDEIIRKAQSLGDLTVLINSAAVFPEHDSINDSLEHYDGIMDVNLKAPLLLSQAFAKAEPKSTTINSHIINILDNRQNKPAGDHLVYRLSKAALWQLTQCLATELAPNFQVNGLALGAIMAPPGADDLHFKRMANKIPLKRTGTPQAVAEAVYFLVSQSFITGAILPIDGGEFL